MTDVLVAVASTRRAHRLAVSWADPSPSLSLDLVYAFLSPRAHVVGHLLGRAPAESATYSGYDRLTGRPPADQTRRACPRFPIRSHSASWRSSRMRGRARCLERVVHDRDSRGSTPARRCQVGSSAACARPPALRAAVSLFLAVTSRLIPCVPFLRSVTLTTLLGMVTISRATRHDVFPWTYVGLAVTSNAGDLHEPGALRSDHVRARSLAEGVQALALYRRLLDLAGPGLCAVAINPCLSFVSRVVSNDAVAGSLRLRDLAEELSDPARRRELLSRPAPTSSLALDDDEAWGARECPGG